ncbi:hypothetical protein OHU45_07825 [Streptomyces tubercidicus]|uniref:hypothetical protein n=1 Tax=Streptomyces tubercidicus TaxID=47759 RepID=UPI002E1192F0|nr:hypothetical protein OG761_07610 [Streptomyces tubercidicus]
MATVRSASSGMRSRGSAVPFRVLWLAALLFSVLVAHGARAETAEGHLVNAMPAAASAATESGAWLAPEHGGHSGQPEHPGHHSDELCVSGQPQQGAAMALPCPTPAADSSRHPLAQSRSGASAGARAAALPPLRNATGSVVQQV